MVRGMSVWVRYDNVCLQQPNAWRLLRHLAHQEQDDATARLQILGNGISHFGMPSRCWLWCFWNTLVMDDRLHCG